MASILMPDVASAFQWIAYILAIFQMQQLLHGEEES
jgi:hypothetical protein